MNDDITAFLPADTDTRRGLTVMEEEFVTYADAKVMLANTAKELSALAENCVSDEWSKGKTIVLEADINLTGLDFEPVPLMNGTFDGQGHSIIGLRFDGAGSTQGLFRAVLKDGAVKNLSVSGSLNAAGNGAGIGGIARRRAALRAVGRRGSLAQLHARRELYRVCSGKRRLGDICRDGADGVPVARHRRRRGCHSRRGGISAVSAKEKTARPRGKRRAGRISKIPHMTMPLRMKIRRGNSFKY